jgi:hypothetical protein
MEREALDEPGFMRERLGVWDDQTTDRVIDPVQWAQLNDPKSELTDPVAFGVDVAQDRSAAAIAAVGRRPDGILHAEVIDCRRGLSWLVPRLVELVERWSPVAVGLDPAGNVGAALPDIEDAGIDPEKLGARELAQACGGFFDDITESRLRHRGQRELDDAVASARKKPVGDAWRWKRVDGTDLSPLYAATVARFAFLTAEDAPVEPWFATS